MMPQALKKSIICLYISMALTVLAILIVVGFEVIGLFTSFSRYYGPNDSDILALVLLGALLMWLMVWLAFKLLVVIQLKRQRYWAWICAIILSAFSCLSLPGIIVGIISLVGLLDKTSVDWFKSKSSSV